MSNTQSNITENKQNIFSPVLIIFVAGILVSMLSVLFKGSLFFEVFSVTGISMIALSSTAILYTYIKGANKTSESSSYISNNITKISNDINSLMRDRHIKDEINDIKQVLLKVNETKFGINDEERAQLLTKIHESIEKNITTSLLEEIESKYSSDMIKSSGLKSVKQKISETIIRLNDELNKLNRRAATNLAIGSSTTMIAAILLAYMVLFSNIKPSDSAQTILWFYIPRLSIIVFIEVFAFFFLRLYRENIHESKYFQNEITNLDSKFIALDTALISGDPENIKTLVNQLSVTERNYILKKGESTVDLERERAEKQAFKDAINSLTGILKNNKK